MKIIPAPTCHYVFPDDHRCGSPSLRNEAFCYFHHPDRQPVVPLPKRNRGPQSAATLSTRTPTRLHKKDPSASKYRE